MRPHAVPILTILSLISHAVSIKPDPSAAYATIVGRRKQGAAAPPSTSDESSSTTTSSTPSSSTTAPSTSSNPTPTSTSDTRASLTDTSPSLTTPSSQLVTSTSRIQSISTSTRSSVAVGDITSSSLTLTATPLSTGRDSASFTVTAVVSRPSEPTTSDGASAPRTGFFAQKGAVVGTFLVVGLFGTAFLFCGFLWMLRRCGHRSRNAQTHLDEDYKEIDHDRNETTPEPTVPVLRDSRAATPISSSPGPNMIEHLHGTNRWAHDLIGGQSRPYSGEFDPYQMHGAANESPIHALGDEQGPDESGPFAYEPQVDEQHLQTIAGPSRTSQRSAESSHQGDSAPGGAQAS